MKVIVVENYDEMSEKAVEMIEKQIQENEKSILGLATGSTPLGLYKRMIEGTENRGISYQKIQSVNLDEYIGIEPSHTQSYHTFMNENLFSKIDIKRENTHIPNGQASSLDEECIRYDELINHIGPVDVQILGIGENGHIGFNEPGTKESTTTHIVELDTSTRKSNARFFDSIEEVPTKAITMGIQSILKSNEIILLASGENKAEAIKVLMSKTIDEKFPASLLWKHGNATLIVDKEAYKLVELER